MKRFVLVALCAAAATACSSSNVDIRQALKKDPQALFDVIEENPEQFVASVNKAAQKAQQSHYEKQAQEARKAQQKDLENPKKPALSADRRLAGDDSAEIVLVEYADFQCPACRMAYDSLKEFKQKYKGQVQFYFKNMPLDFHPMASPAAFYFEAIRKQDPVKARRFYEYVFENQRQISEDGFLKKAAKVVGADLAKVEKDKESDDVKNVIAADMKEFEGFGFTGTPSFILNGVAMNGAPSIEELDRIVEMTRKKN